MPSNLSLALIGRLHIKPMIIGNYLSLNKKRKMGVCDADTVCMVYCGYLRGWEVRIESAHHVII